MSPEEQRLHDLTWCLANLRPEARRLEEEQWSCVGIPWRFFRWLRAYRAHKALNARWRRILDGIEHAP